MKQAVFPSRTLPPESAISRRKSKYTVAPAAARTMDGILFASKAEMAEYADLRIRVRLGEISDLECQPKMPVMINGMLFAVYTPDFKFWEIEDRAWRYVEVKSGRSGKERDYKLRRKAAELYHGVKITEVTR